MAALAALFSRLREIVRRLRELVRAVIRVAQRVVMAVSLFLVYFLALGLTKLFAAVFQRHLLRWDPAGRDSYWVPAKDYEPDHERSLRQT